MKTKAFGVTLANMVMEAVSSLQKARKNAAIKDIREFIAQKHGQKNDKFLKLVPHCIKKGINLGLLAKFKNNYRTKIYVARRRRRRGGLKKKRRRRRRRNA